MSTEFEKQNGANPSKEALIAEIMYLAAVANFKTERCIFVNFSGHVNTLEIDIRKDKNQYGTEIASSYITLMPYETMTDQQKQRFNERVINKLLDIKTVLESLIQDGDIDKEKLHEYVVKTVKYTF